MNDTEPSSAALWVVRSPESPESAHIALLDDSERRQCARFRQPERQARYACGRALLRLVLAERCAADPGTFRFEIDANRRPALTGASRALLPDLDFNLSSTSGLVACAVARRARVGVDIERPGRGPLDEALKARVASREERDWLDQSADPDRDFYRLWTLKEAVAKADGQGLGLPFNQLTLLPKTSGDLAMNLDAMDERPDDWQVFSLDASVPAALAIRSGAHHSSRPDLAPLLPEAKGLFNAVAVTPLAASKGLKAA